MQPASSGIRRFATALPGVFKQLDDLTIHSPADVLRDWGFDGAWIGEDAGALGLQAAASAMEAAALAPEEVDAVFWVSALARHHQRPIPETTGSDLLERFCYTGSWLQHELGLSNATVCGIAQQGCAGMFSAMRQARALLHSEPEINHVLCAAADVLPAGSEREVLYNVISDAGCACIVSREPLQYRWLGYAQISRGYYWNVPAMQREIIAAYYPTAAMAIRNLLLRCSLTPSGVDLVIPTGVNRSSWPILMRMCGIDGDRLFEPGVRFGHTISADSFLMLEQAKRQSRLRPGMKLLLFAYGFGSSWSALLLETTERVNE